MGEVAGDEKKDETRRQTDRSTDSPIRQTTAASKQSNKPASQPAEQPQSQPGCCSLLSAAAGKTRTASGHKWGCTYVPGTRRASCPLGCLRWILLQGPGKFDSCTNWPRTQCECRANPSADRLISRPHLEPNRGGRAWNGSKLSLAPSAQRAPTAMCSFSSAFRFNHHACIMCIIASCIIGR